MLERQPRKPFPRPVQIHVVGDESRRRLVAGNLSRGGMFLRSESVLPAGTRLSLSLEAKGKALPFAEGEVVWSADPGEWSEQGRVPGFGVRFLRFLNPRAPELLDTLLQRTPAKAQAAMQPIEDLNPSSPPAPAPAWSDSDSIELTPPEPEDLPVIELETDEKGDRWFREPTESHPPSAFDTNDSSTRVGAAAVLLVFLAVVAGGLLWVIRRDAPPPTEGDVAEAEATQVAQTEVEPVRQTVPSVPAEPKTLQAEPVEAPRAAAVEPKSAPQADPKPTVEAQPKILQAEPKIVQAEPVEAPRAPAAEPKPAAAKATTHHLALSTGAVKSVSLSRAGKDVRATLSFASGSKVDRVFVLKSPNRVVVDVKGPTPQGSAQLKAGVPGIDTLRVGALKNGTRLVFDVPSLAGSATMNGNTVSFEVR